MQFRSIAVIIVLSVLSTTLLGCASTPATPAIPQPSIESENPNSTPSAVTEPTVTPTPTRGPIVTPPAVAQCEPFFLPTQDSPLPLPDLNSLRWEAITVDGQPMRRLTELPLEPTAFTSSRDGSYLAMLLQPYRATQGAIAVVPRDNTPSWWITQATNINLASDPPPLTQWLATGEGIWADATGLVHIGISDSRVITPPVPMSEVPYAVGTTAITVSRDDQTLWRLDTTNGAWETIEPAISLNGGAILNYSALSHDSTFIMLMVGNTLRKIPIAMGEASSSTPLESYDVVGSGQAPSPPIQLSNTSYWLVRLPIEPTDPLTVENRALWQSGFIVNADDGSILTLANFPIPTPYDFVSGFTLSPNGQWLAVSVASRASTATETLQQAVYVTLADAFDQGQLIENVESISILSDPAMLIGRDITTDTLIAYPLPYNPDNRYPLVNAGEFLAVALQRLYVRAADDSTRILVFDTRGRLRQSVGISPPYHHFTGVRATGDTIWFSMSYPDDNGNCLYDVVEWDTTP